MSPLKIFWSFGQSNFGKKARLGWLIDHPSVLASAVAFLETLLGLERRKTGWMRAVAAGDADPWRQQAVMERNHWDADPSINGVLYPGPVEATSRKARSGYQQRSVAVEVPTPLRRDADHDDAHQRVRPDEPRIRSSECGDHLLLSHIRPENHGCERLRGGRLKRPHAHSRGKRANEENRHC